MAYNNRNLLFEIPGLGSPTSGYLGLISDKPSCLSFYEFPVVEGMTSEAGWVLFYKGANLLHEGSTFMTLFKPNYLPKATPPNTIAMGFGLNIWILGRHKHSVYSKWHLLFI